MAEDLVKRLRENHEALRGPDYYEAYTTIEQQAASLAGKDKEIERLQRRFDLELDSYAKDHDLQAALSRAEQAEQERDELREWKQNQQVHWPSEIERRNRDLEQAERALAEAVEVLRPFAEGSLDVSGTAVIIGYSGVVQALVAARAFVAQHGSDSREGK